jgi:alkanesulfonate monooxygenase SsuD/methylene tetrahydromethanopterin reductase-like flavin-dependent oxidoreductase (luciferase family)
MQFFPDVGPDQKSAEQYFDESLRLVELCDPHGWKHVRTVEHYFTPYGGYSPNPLLFLTAAAARTRTARLITGAILPVFNNPLKLAGEIGMLDAISHGRVEIGFARAFLPHEFARFGISVNESRDRFNEGLEQIRLLLEEENVASAGRFHKFGPTTSLPRPTQKPRPPFWIAALSTPESFATAGRLGHAVMAIPIAGSLTRELTDVYRKAWRDAGHPGNGRVMLAFHLCCHEDRDTAWRIARAPLARYLKSISDAVSDWAGMSSTAYPGYDKIAETLKRETVESQAETGSAWIGTPDDVAETIEQCRERFGEFESASLQLNFNDVSFADAEHSARLFAEKVMPRFFAA